MTSASDARLRRLRADFLRMLSHVAEQVALAADVLFEGRVEYVGAIHELDRRVGELELELEAQCLEALGDAALDRAQLHFVALIFRSLADLERVGDYAVHVADDARLLAVEPPIRRYPDLRRMLSFIKLMLDRTARALTEGDALLADAAVRLDLDIDDLHEQFQRELVVYLLEVPLAAPQGLALLQIARSLQRMGDHVENVGERLAAWLRPREDHRPN